MKINWSRVHKYLDDFSTSGWRKLFFWSSVGTIAVALPVAYVYQPFHNHYAPTEYLGQLNTTMMIVLGMAGLRAGEKMVQANRDNNGSAAQA